MDKFRQVASKYQDDRPDLARKAGAEDKLLANKGVAGRAKPVTARRAIGENA